MTDFTNTELQLMLKNMGGFTGVETMMICSKIIAELDRRKVMSHAKSGPRTSSTKFWTTEEEIKKGDKSAGVEQYLN